MGFFPFFVQVVCATGSSAPHNYTVLQTLLVELHVDGYIYNSVHNNSRIIPLCTLIEPLTNQISSQNYLPLVTRQEF